MPNRFFVAEAQNRFAALRCSGGGEPETCDLAQAAFELKPIRTIDELEAIEFVLSSTACMGCLECVQEKFEPEVS